MFGLPEKHPFFNRSVLWSIVVGSVALVVPLALARSMTMRSQSVTPSSKPSPLSTPSPQLSQDKLTAEQEWRLRLVSQGLSW